MDVVKRRIITRIEEIRDSKDPEHRDRLVGLQEALDIINEVEKQAPRESWGDY